MVHIQVAKAATATTKLRTKEEILTTKGLSETIGLLAKVSAIECIKEYIATAKPEAIAELAKH